MKYLIEAATHVERNQLPIIMFVRVEGIEIVARGAHHRIINWEQIETSHINIVAATIDRMVFNR